MNNQPVEPEKSHWDVIVVGTGMGGAALGYALASEGRRVLFCEQGCSSLPGSEALRGKYAELLARDKAASERTAVFRAAGRWVEPLRDCSEEPPLEYVPFVGAGSGGSTALYGAALERFFPEDFHPRRHHRPDAGCTLPESWPFDYHDLVPWYRQVEALFRVRGEPDPLRSDAGTYGLLPPPSLCPANRYLVEHLVSQGLHPYRLPVAADFRPGCTTCQGYLCSSFCKHDANTAFLWPAIEEHGAALLENCKAVRLQADRERVTAVECVWRERTIRLQAETVVLAAGALATPMLLFASASSRWPDGLANGSGMVGRNLMRHFVDLYALFPRVKPGPGENTKEIAFNDFYLHDGVKLGSVQSFGWLPPAPLLADDLQQQIREGPGAFMAGLFGTVKPLVRRVLEHTLCRSLVLATTLEDLPYPGNRIFPDSRGRMALSYHVGEEGRKRIQLFRHHMQEKLEGLRHLLLRQAENNQRLAHACGTCRMGNDPATSVVDAYNRAHELKNLYIVDASFFPSSGGTNPSLTIAANALRVAAHLTENG